MSPRACFLLPILLLLCLLSSLNARHATAQALAGFSEFRGRLGGVAANEMEVYRPMLERVLTAELHFAKKICEPDEREFKLIHRVGLEAIIDVAGIYAQLQRRRGKLETWPDPNEAIAEALLEVIEKTLPRETAARYQSEISARFAANRAANAAAFVSLIDQHVLLQPAQQHRLYDELRDHWQSHWSTTRVVLNYKQYATVPEIDVLRPHLSELQQRLWSLRPKSRNISLAWQTQFGENELLARLSLNDFDDPDGTGSQATDAANANAANANAANANRAGSVE